MGGLLHETKRGTILNRHSQKFGIKDLPDALRGEVRPEGGKEGNSSIHYGVCGTKSKYTLTDNLTKLVS